MILRHPKFDVGNRVFKLRHQKLFTHTHTHTHTHPENIATCVDEERPQRECREAPRENEVEIIKVK